MEVGVLAVRYAKALYEYALKKGVTEDVYHTARTIIGSFVANPSVAKVLEDPLLPMTDKLALMNSSTGLEPSRNPLLHEVFNNYFTLLLNNKRENYLISSLYYYQQIYRKENNIAIAKITTAIPLEGEMEKVILSKASKVLGKKIELEQSVIPEIVGGFILDVDDYRIDASVVAQVNKIKRTLLDKNRRIV